MDVTIKFDDAKNSNKWLDALKANDLKTIKSLKDKMRSSEPLRYSSGKLYITDTITDLLEAVTTFCSSDRLSEKLVETLVSNIFRFAEMYNALFCWLELKPTAFDNPKNQTENLWRFLVALPLPKEHLYPLLESECYSKFDMSEKRRTTLYEKAWLKHLYRGIPQNMVVQVLRKLTNESMDCFTDSDLVGDFLTSFIEKSETNYGIFALKGIAKLMFEKNFSYPNFYESLYTKFPAIVTFPSFEAIEFLADFDMYMSSSHVPAYIIAAFAKRVSRTCLVAHAELLELLLQTLRNMFINHQVVKQMLHREDIENLEKDPYIEDVHFKECHAMESSLWEVGAIFRHWNQDVTKRVEFAESKLKVTFNPDLRPTTSEEIFEHSYAKGAKKLENCAVQDPRLIKDKNWLSL
jgi:hypothetical protein